MLETFVECGRFRSTCYKAAGWHFAGKTKGRTRNDSLYNLKVLLKDIYLYPLSKRFREVLMAPLKALMYTQVTGFIQGMLSLWKIFNITLYYFKIIFFQYSLPLGTDRMLLLFYQYFPHGQSHKLLILT